MFYYVNIILSKIGLGGGVEGVRENRKRIWVSDKRGERDREGQRGTEIATDTGNKLQYNP